jgi:putative ABC transport system permease protein
MNPLPMVWADLKSMRGVAFVSIALIALAVAVGVAIGAQERALRIATARAADDFPILIGAAGSVTQLVLTSVYLQPEALPLMDGAILDQIAGDPRVAEAAPIAFGDVVLGYPVVGTTADFVTRWGRLSLVEGRNFSVAGDAVVGADVKLRLGQTMTPSHATTVHVRALGVEDTEDIANEHAGVIYRVVGRLPRLNSPWDRAVLIPVESVWTTHGLSNGHTSDRIGFPFEAAHLPGVPAVVVKPRQVFQAYQLRSDYRKDGRIAVFPAEVLVALYHTLGDIRQILVTASVLNNVLVFLAILMLLITLVGLRRRRYAILRALGASRGYIALVVWLGSTALLATGALVGLGLGWLGAKAVAWVIEQQTGLVLQVGVNASEWLIAVGMAGLGSVIALIPALVALRGDVSKSLRA